MTEPGSSSTCSSRDSIGSVNEDSNPKKKPTRSLMFGYLFSVVSALCMALSGICLKLAAGAETTQMVVLTSIIQFLYLIPLITYKKINVLGPNLKTVGFLTIRGVAGSVSIIFFAMSIQHLPVGTVTSIAYIYPALVGLFAWVCLREKCSVVRGVLTVLTFIGLLFVSEPPFIFGGEPVDHKGTSNTRVLGVIYAISCAVLAAISIIITRKLGSGIHFSHLLMYSTVEGFIIVLLQLYLSGKSIVPCRQHLLTLSLSAVFMNVGHIFLTLALQRERAGPVTSVNTSQLVFVFILEYLVFGVVPTTYGFVGASLILVCAVVQSLESTVKNSIRKCN
ncbi:unnamed protein product [Clavelina lepadiformis]|uniref:EamA domain-containing protein n=1 Tax=Clavelina lepadiformis TaxID=159417 RepID=A0ABP0FGQ8_CLALP